MKSNSLFSHLRSSFLGAVDGLLLGVIVEIVRRIYTPIFLEYYTNKAFEENGGIHVSTTYYIGRYIDIPLFCIAVFATVIPLVNWLLKKYRLSPPLLWQLSGMVAAIIAVLLHAWLNPLAHHT